MHLWRRPSDATRSGLVNGFASPAVLSLRRPFCPAKHNNFINKTVILGSVVLKGRSKYKTINAEKLFIFWKFPP